MPDHTTCAHDAPARDVLAPHTTASSAQLGLLLPRWGPSCFLVDRSISRNPQDASGASQKPLRLLVIPLIYSAWGLRNHAKNCHSWRLMGLSNYTCSGRIRRAVSGPTGTATGLGPFQRYASPHTNTSLLRRCGLGGAGRAHIIRVIWAPPGLDY